MPKPKPAVAALAALAASAFALAACSRPASSVPAGPGAAGGQPLARQKITLYSGQHEQTVKALADDFAKRTGV